MAYDFTKMRNILSDWNLELTAEKEQQFLTFYEMLVEKNKVMNLTAITEFEDVVEKHFLDSISLCQVMDLKKPLTLLDLGTGAGFPGIPLKIMFPELKITLADSLNKRLVFLNEVIVTLKLKNIETVHGRAEELSKRKDYRESFDLCVSRAVANLSALSEYCLPFIHKRTFNVTIRQCKVNYILYLAAQHENCLLCILQLIFHLSGLIRDKFAACVDKW